MSTKSLLRVSTVQVEGLFDRFDHQVDLNPDDRVTILHGPNGVGKTMLLRMINDLLIGRYSRYPFGVSHWRLPTVPKATVVPSSS